jgi:hypothetical protein
MNHAAAFLDAFVQDEVMCRCLDEEDFGQPLDNDENDVPLYGMKRPGVTGLIPSMEEGLAMGASPKPRSLVLELEEPDEKERMLSAKRLGLSR